MTKYVSLRLAFGLAATSAVIYGGIFYWQYLRGAWPVWISPSGTVSVAPSTGPLIPANRTGLPLTVQGGFAVSIYADKLGEPRVLTSDPRGRILTSITSQGKVVALPDDDGNGVADRVVTVLSGLRKPHGLAGRCRDSVDGCSLYVAEENLVAVYDYDSENITATNKRKLADLPSGGGHYTRTIAFGPDGRLYISIGSSCNVCHESDPRRAAIYSMEKDGSDFKLFARGLRNGVFFDWHPVSKELWITEMGRDYLGDDLPPDEINVVSDTRGDSAVPNFGWPICYGKNVHDGVFDKNTYIRDPCMEPFESPSRIDIPAHSAPLGLAFVAPGNNWPSEYRGNLLVAYHGSWNRSAPTGYKVVRYVFDDSGNLAETEDFVSGWITDDKVYGRPVDILMMPDGTAYISDDKAGVIYRVIYAGQTTTEDRSTTDTCISRPACLNATPRCLIPEPIEGWCPSAGSGQVLTSTPKPTVGGGCYVGGCSQQLCTDQKGMTSTCEFRAEYACYRSAVCGRQSSGQCGWTLTEELRMCLEKTIN